MEILCLTPNCVCEEFTSQISRNIRFVAQQYVKMKTENKYLFLTEFEGPTVSYDRVFSPSIYGPSANINRRRENEDP